jgi:glucose-1-phosphate adenylyltransferase
MDSHIIILAGGAASRMKQAQEVNLDERLSKEVLTKAKAMLPVGRNGRPFLDYLLYNIAQAGYRNVVIVVGEKDRSIKHYYVDEGAALRFDSLAFSFVRQPIPAGRSKPLGTADALLRALRSVPHWSGQRFTVCNSDNLYSSTALRLLLEDDHPNAMIDYDRGALQYPEHRISKFSVIMKDHDGFLTDIIEKPEAIDLERARDAHGRIGVSMNLWRFSYDQILPYLEAIPLHPVREEKELPLAVRMMVAQHPKAVFTIPIAEHVIDLTSPGDIHTVHEYLVSQFPEL